MMRPKRILITGAGRGIGARCAEVLATEGHALALVARTGREVEDRARHIRQAVAGATVIPMTVDVAGFDDVSRIVAEAADQLGGIDALVNNAAIPGPCAPLETASRVDWDYTLQVNVLGVVNCCRAVLPLMKAAGGGTIINLVGAGVGWKVFQPGKTAYITSKFAVYGFTEALAREVEDANIRVNALSPGSVDTCLRDGLVDDAQRRRVRENAEDLSPDAAARMVSFLVSEKCGPLTGKIISARWDDPDILAAQSQQLNNRCLMTLRKIDGRNYLESPADL